MTIAGPLQPGSSRRRRLTVRAVGLLAVMSGLCSACEDSQKNAGGTRLTDDELCQVWQMVLAEAPIDAAHLVRASRHDDVRSGRLEDLAYASADPRKWAANFGECTAFSGHDAGGTQADGHQLVLQWLGERFAASEDEGLAAARMLDGLYVGVLRSHEAVASRPWMYCLKQRQLLLRECVRLSDAGEHSRGGSKPCIESLLARHEAFTDQHFRSEVRSYRADTPRWNCP